MSHTLLIIIIHPTEYTTYYNYKACSYALCKMLDLVTLYNFQDLHLTFLPLLLSSPTSTPSPLSHDMCSDDDS